MKPENYFTTVHSPRLSMADDGFGNLIDVECEVMQFNFQERICDLDSVGFNDF